MKLTRYTDYSLRLMMYLGLNPDRLCTITEIADRYTISRNHLTRVALQLGHLGYIETVRGRKGGLRLKTTPAAINVGRLVRDTEPDFSLAQCFDSPEQCALSPACQLQSALKKALAAFLQVLDQYTLADLLRSPAKLRLLVQER